jgi:hypothetical protein
LLPTLVPLATLLLLAPGAAKNARAEASSAPAAAAPRTQDYQAWWDRQREREAADRFWNGPRERRRNLTRDQIERWEAQRDRHHRNPRWPF